MSDLKELQERVKLKREKQAALIHKHRMKKHSHYRAWFYTDEKINEWLSNDKLNDSQRNVLLKIRNMNLLLYSVIETSSHIDSTNIGDDHLIEMMISKDGSLKELRSSLNDSNKKLRIESEKRIALEKEVESLRREVEYYERES